MPRFDTESAPFNPWGLIDPDIAAALQRAGVTVVADPGLSLNSGPVGGWNPATNQVIYDPNAGGVPGILQHEFVHAATANLNPAQIGQPFNLKYGLTHALLRARMSSVGRAPAFRGQFFVAPFVAKTDPWAEGLADRSGAYGSRSERFESEAPYRGGYPTWGESIRTRIVPYPTDNPYVTRPR